jgi:hypothetical protein
MCDIIIERVYYCKPRLCDCQLSCTLLIVNWFRLYNIRRKKNACGSGSQPTQFFSADPIIFSKRLTVRPYFLRVVAGCCQNGVCCHTIIIGKKHEKNIQKKLFLTLIFSRYETGTTGIFFYALQYTNLSPHYIRSVLDLLIIVSSTLVIT